MRRCSLPTDSTPARSANAVGTVPKVDHVDLIAGEVTGRTGDRNLTTKVVRRFPARDWRRDGDHLVIEHQMPAAGAGYLRVRGTGTPEAEPATDIAGGNPRHDLWFYSNPVYMQNCATAIGR